MPRRAVVTEKEASIRVAAVAVARAKYGSTQLTPDAIREAASVLSQRTGKGHAAALTYEMIEALHLAAQALRRDGREDLIASEYRRH